ncbi:MAG: thioesterase family protein [Kiritimatiellae bacterium]|nr:thioesterase family protein [Kiritimatiellia bacterium]MCO5061935.1 thioesterase family protein [Kiritimatiellia bacterium]MCO6401423.1 acyl-CoA thioesterase [Verrucomicrobiota bacterium]
MPRQKINLPERWAFSTAIPVRITDLNYGRHVGNDTMLSLLQEARVQWLRGLGYPSELLAEPVGLILVDIGIRFKAELVYGDVATVSIAVTEVSKRGFELTYFVTKGDEAAEVARATTGFVFFDYAARRLAEPPAEFFAKAGAPAA